MKQLCIFCGEKPIAKNKEHVIPLWLISMTGDPNRNINLGFDARHFTATGEFKIRSFSFDQFQFPACSDCNCEFSGLESRAKQYMLRLFEKDYFTNVEIDDFLDWFDKIRIGLWLAYITLDETIKDVVPKFHIKKRIGHRDRCLFIYELKDDGSKGVQFLCCNSPGFQFIPSCCTLRVNNVYFYNYSFDFLFSHKIGFPYPTVFANTDTVERHTQIELEHGSQKIVEPLLPFKVLKAATYIYQPIIPKEVLGTDLEKEFYKNQYVLDNTLKGKVEKGSVFYFDQKLIKLDDQTELQLYSESQDLNPISFPRVILKQTAETLERLIQIRPQDHLLTKQQQSVLNQNRLLLLKAHRSYMSGI